tara:strand:+ start:7138 stop:7326 length:189 start_codon:yes stop_codon:yes gene_type:complete
MKNLIFIIVLLVNFNVFAEKEYQKTFYENGNIKAEGWLENNQKIAYLKCCYKNGIVEKEGHF